MVPRLERGLRMLYLPRWPRFDYRRRSTADPLDAPPRSASRAGLRAGKPMKRKHNVERLRHTQGCLTDCVGYVLNQHPHRLPYFVYPREGWMQRVRRFFRRCGYEAKWHRCSTVPQRGTHIVCGDSLCWKTAAHAVVYRNGRLVFDPDYPSRWSARRITHRLILVRTSVPQPKER